MKRRECCWQLVAQTALEAGSTRTTATTFIARGLASMFAGSSSVFLPWRARLDDSVYRSFYRGRLGIFGSRASISDRKQR